MSIRSKILREEAGVKVKGSPCSRECGPAKSRVLSLVEGLICRVEDKWRTCVRYKVALSAQLETGSQNGTCTAHQNLES